jgi:hypothetical protein
MQFATSLFKAVERLPGCWKPEEPQQVPFTAGLKNHILRLMMGRSLVGASIDCYVVAHILKARANEEDDVMLSAFCGTPPDDEQCASAAVLSDTGPLPIPRPPSQRPPPWVSKRILLI